MAEPLITLTITQEEIRRYADAALGDPMGVIVFFETAEYATPEACKKAASTFRSNFNSLKSKDRRLQKKLSGRSEFDIIRGIYDDLGCFLDQTPSGWSARISKGKAALGRLRVVSASTGEPVREFTEDYSRWADLSIKVDRASEAEPPPLTEEETAFFWAYNPPGAEFLWKWEVPSGIDAGGNPAQIG